MPEWILNVLSEDLIPDIGHVTADPDLIEDDSDQGVLIDFMEVTTD